MEESTGYAAVTAGGYTDVPVAEPSATGGVAEVDGLSGQSEEELAEQADHIRRLRQQGLLLAGGVAGFGSGDAAGTMHKYYVSPSEAGPVDAQISAIELDRQRELYVAACSHPELRRRLTQKGVAVLRGAPGSGRSFTAVLAAQEAMDAEVIHLDAEAGLKRLVSNQDGERGDLRPGFGHVIEGDGSPWASMLRAQLLSRMSAETYRRSPLVVIVDDQVSVDGLDEYVVEHRSTDDLRFQVLARHLTVLLEDRPEERRKLVEHEALRDELRGRTSMAEIAGLARQLARSVRDGQDTDQIVQGLKARLRSRAERLLRPPEQSGGGTKHEVSLWSRAFLLACVVLDGKPLSRVSRESHRLAELLHGVRSPSSVPEMPLFQESLADWLNQSDVKFTDREGNPVAARHSECLVKISQSGLGESVLEVLWHDHSGARRPLLEWLDGLVISGEEDIRVSAAQTVGLLATFDWTYVQEAQLARWATDRSEHAVRRRYGAAWALERAAYDAVLDARVRRLLRNWSQRRPYQACAEAAYGTEIGARFPDEALNNLEKIARLSFKSVKDAVQEIYAAGSRPQVLRRLADWSVSPQDRLCDDASACLKQLSRFRGDLAVTGFLAEPMSRGDLRKLTRNVLFHRKYVIQRRGWETLRLWVERAGDEPGLAEALGEFIAELPPDEGERTDALRARFVFYLQLWKHKGIGADAPEVIDSVVRERWSM